MSTLSSSLVLESAELAGETTGEYVNIEAVLERVNSRLDYVKTRVYETVNCKLKEYVAAFKHTAELRKEVEALSTRVDEVRTHCGKDISTAGAALDSNLAQDQEVSQQLEHTDVLISILRLLVRVHEELSGFDSKMARADYAAAAASVCDMREAIQQLPTEDSDGIDPTIFVQVKEQFQRKRSAIKCTLDDLFQKAITFGGCSLQVLTQVESGSVSTSLAEVLECLQTLGWLDQRLDNMADQLRANVFEPILKRSKTKVEIVKDGHKQTLSCVDDPKAPTTLQPERLFSNLLTVVNFLGDVFDPVDEVVAHVGRVLWTGAALCGAIVEDCLVRSIPSEISALKGYQPTVEATKQFEHTLLSRDFITQEQLLLTAFMNDIDRHFAEKKRRQFATQARVLIMEDDHNTVEISDATEAGSITSMTEPAILEQLQRVSSNPNVFEDSFFRLPKCRVSNSAVSIVAMLHQALEEASASSSSTCQVALYGAARDILDLWRAIVVARHANTLQKVPQLCAIFHNDCQYLAYHCVTLGYRFKWRLEQPLQQWGTFIDMVPAFRQLGEKHLNTMLQSQRAEITSCLNAACGFTRLDDETSRNQAENALLRVKHHLEHLQRIWKSVFPEGLYWSVLGSLCDFASQRIVEDIAQLPGVPRGSLGHLADLTSCFVQWVKALLAGADSIELVVSNWSKVVSLTAVLQQVKAPELLVGGRAAAFQSFQSALADVRESFKQDARGLLLSLLSMESELVELVIDEFDQLE